MAWLHRHRPLTRADMEAAIRSSEGYLAGRELRQNTEQSLSGWVWLRPLPHNPRYEIARECGEEEIRRLNSLLKGEICLRVERSDQIRFILASID